MMKLRRDTGGFNGRLEYAMFEREITIRELSEKIKYSENAINHWLAGTVEPGMNAIRSLATVLNVSADWLICLLPFETQVFEEAV